MAHDGGSNKKEVTNILYNIGRVSVLQKDYSMALKMLNESLRLEKELHGDKSMEAVDTLNLIGFVYFSTKAFDQAMVIFTEALSIVNATHGSVHEKVAISLLNVGMVLEKQEHLEEALRCFSTAQDVCKKVGLKKDNRSMRTATRSVNEIEQLVLVKQAQSSRQENVDRNTQNQYTAESSFLQNRKHSKVPYQTTTTTTSSNNPTSGVIINNYDPCSRIRTDGKYTTDSTIYEEEYHSEQSLTEYREDPYWELDDSSMVEEYRDDRF